MRKISKSNNVRNKSWVKRRKRSMEEKGTQERAKNEQIKNIENPKPTN